MSLTDDPTNQGLYRYQMCGLSNVYLDGGVHRHETGYGPGVSIAATGNLQDEIALWLVKQTGPLSGAALRFVRTELELSPEEASLRTGYSADSIRYFESQGAEDPIPGPLDRLVRVLWISTSNADVDIWEALALAAQGDSPSKADGVFRYVDGTWRLVAVH